MQESFDKKLWEVVADSPELQQTIIESLKTPNRGYSIPTGDIVVSVFGIEDQDKLKRAVKALNKARDLKVSELSKILAELSTYYTFKQAEGKELDNYEKTLKDLDIDALAVTALLRWIKYRTPERGQ